MMQVRVLLRALFLACLVLSDAQNKEPTTSSKCSYTFIIPQQKITGAICVNTRYQEVSPTVNQTELQELRHELRRQHFQIGQLKRVVEADRAIVGEVKLLRKENRSMNARVSQLYAQLLYEIIQRKDSSPETSQLETRVLNTTAEALDIAAQYWDLQQKYGQLVSLINNQSVAIARLERECQRSAGGRCTDQGPIEPPLVNVIPYDSVMGNASKTLSEVLKSQPEAGSPSSQDQKQHIQKEMMITRDTGASASTKGANSYVMLSALPTAAGPWRDCWNALQNGKAAASGLYLVRPDSGNQMMQVWCEQEQEGGGWTVIQRRQDGSVNFFTTWEQYKQGFGNMDGEHWLGLENLYWLTSQDHYKLLILLEDWKGQQVQAEYDYFAVGPESDFYRLQLGQYRGDAGDSLSWHADKQFSTLDNDRDAYSGNCAHYQKGGWWYNMCAHSNLNGVWYRGGHYRSRFQDGMYWAEFRGGAYSLKKVLMMIKPNK